uniref:Amino acid transporter transmembrane domain-containing protein n=1 Tax=Meloidogyne incognita TaxID=6306 RepID=A0A914LGA5_MELIC
MENKLKRPSQMLGPFGILSSGIFLATLVYSSIGFFGYVAYGDKIKGSITQNLPQHQMLVLIKFKTKKSAKNFYPQESPQIKSAKILRTKFLFAKFLSTLRNM